MSLIVVVFKVCVCWVSCTDIWFIVRVRVVKLSWVLNWSQRFFPPTPQPCFCPLYSYTNTFSPVLPHHLHSLLAKHAFLNNSSVIIKRRFKRNTFSHEANWISFQSLTGNVSESIFQIIFGVLLFSPYSFSLLKRTKMKIRVVFFSHILKYKSSKHTVELW